MVVVTSHPVVREEGVLVAGVAIPTAAVAGAASTCEAGDTDGPIRRVAAADELDGEASGARTSIARGYAAVAVGCTGVAANLVGAVAARGQARLAGGPFAAVFPQGEAREVPIKAAG